MAMTSRQTDITWARSPVAGGEHTPVCGEGDGVQVAGRDRAELPPPCYLALPPAVVPHSRGRAICPEPDGVPVSRRDGNQLVPRINIAGSLTTPARGACRPVGEDRECAAPAGGDAHNARPFVDVALPILVPAGREDRAVRAQSHGVG
jgi:hypothetical protein